MAEDNPLAMPTLTKLSNELDSVVDWHLLGVKLGIKAHVLETINSNYHGDAVRCKHMMLSHWLQNSKPTWKAVADGLCLMGKHAVALQIRGKYCSSSAATDTETPFATSLQNPSSVTVVAFAKRRIQMIQGKFSMLVTKSLRRLQKRKINVKDVQMFLVTMYSSPNSRDGNDIVITVIESAKTLDAIFRALSKCRLWDCFNYYLLQNIIEEFASEDDELNRMMQNYQKDLTGYVLGLKIETYLDAYLDANEHSTTTSDSEDSANEIITLPPQQKHELFKKLTAKVSANVTDHSLAFVNDLWRSLASQFALPRPAMMLHKVAKGCISITWLIPANLVKHVTRMAQKTSNMFAEKQILRVMLEEQCIYSTQSSSKRFTRGDTPTFDIAVMTPFQELADELSNKHGLPLRPVIMSEETGNISGYTQGVYSALNDSNCQVVYFIWSHNMGEASKVTDPPLSDIVRELVARPHSATELQKVVFVQLGSKSAVPLSTMIHQFSLEECPSDEHFNVYECANSIYEKACDLLRSDELQSSDDVDGVVAQKTFPKKVAPIDTSSSQSDTLPPSPLPPLPPPPSPLPPPPLPPPSLPPPPSPLPLPPLPPPPSPLPPPPLPPPSLPPPPLPLPLPDTDIPLHLMKEQLEEQKELIEGVRELHKQVANISVKQGDEVVVGNYEKQERWFNKLLLKMKLLTKKIPSFRRWRMLFRTTKNAQQGKEGGPLPEVKVDVEQPVQGSAPSPVSHPFPATDKFEEEGSQSLDDKPVAEQQVEEEIVNLEQPVQNLTNTSQQQLPRYAPSPLSQPSPTTNKSIVVVTPFPELANELRIKHGITLRHIKLDEKARILSSYNQHIYSALNDSNCQVVYFIWSHSIEEASKVTDPPLSDLVRELVARPLPATDLKKVVFVQLGSKSALPLSTMIHQFSLEECPSDGHFNVHECANSIYEKARDLLRSNELQSSDDVDDVDRVTRRIARTVSNEITPTEPSPPQNITPPPSPPPPSYNTATNTGGLESRSMPAIGQSRIVEQLRIAESASVGDSPQIEHIMKAQLAAQQQLVGEVRELRKTIGDTAERHGDKVVAAIQGERFDEATLKEMVHTADTLVQKTVEGVQDLRAFLFSHESTSHVEELGDDVQDLRERFDEATLEQELPRENQKS